MTDSYIGVPPQSGFISQEANQYFTGLTQNYIDLNQSISSLSSVIILVNGVVQENSTMSLTSSTRITLGDTLVSADKVTCIYVAKISSTQAPAIGSVTSDMLSGSIANSKLANSSITLNGSAVSLGGSATVGGDNTPMFRARLSANVNSTQQVNTKVTFNVEDYDTDSAFDTSNGRFTIPSGKSGKYAIYGGLIIRDYQHDSGHSWALSIIYKNGSAVMTSGWQFQGNYGSKTFKQVYSVFDCSVGDYFELYYYTVTSDSGNGEVLADSNGTYFGGHKLIS